MFCPDLYGLKSNSSGVFVGSLSHLLEICPNVEIEGCTCVGVSQYLLDALYIGTIHQKERGTRMPQIVGGKVWQMPPVDKSLNPSCNRVRIDRLKQIFFAVKNESII